MKNLWSILLLMFALFEISSAQGTKDRSAVKCAADSPERCGEEGCNKRRSAAENRTNQRVDPVLLTSSDRFEVIEYATATNTIASAINKRDDIVDRFEMPNGKVRSFLLRAKRGR